MECELTADRVRLVLMSKFKYFGCFLDDSGSDETECRRKVSSEREVVGAIRSLVNARCSHFECARILHETLLVLVLMYGSKTLLCVGRIDKVPNAWIRVLCEVTKRVDKRIDEDIL